MFCILYRIGATVLLSAETFWSIPLYILADGFIGVNCFGFGGVNGHVVLKPYQAKRKSFTGDYITLLYYMQYLFWFKMYFSNRCN